MPFNNLLMFNEYELVLNYFIKRNLEVLGLLKYKHFKNLIKYCLDKMNDYEARKIFNILFKLGYFEKVKLRNKKRTFEYRFLNPYVILEKPKQIIIYFE